MKLQISFDMTDLDKAINVASQVADYADILEVGTLLIYTHGIKAVEQFKKTFPSKTILADTKIIDRGKEAVTVLANAGADWITVMAGTSKDVIHSVSKAAHDLNVKVMMDLLDSSSLGQSAMEAKNLGANALLFHQPYDEKESLIFLDKWEMVKGNSALPVFVSAKIKRETINKIINIKPDGIIIGRSITLADNPQAEAAFFHEIISQNP